MKDIINISSLDDIESLFARLDGGEEITIDRIKLDLFNNVNFKIYGDPSRYNGTLPSPLAQGLCEFQTEIYQVFTLIKYKTDNLQRLTGKDKEEAEIIFTINEGCTDILVALTELFEAFGKAFEKVTHGMSPSQKTLCFLFAVTVIGGAWVGTSYLEKQAEVEVKQEETKLEEAKIKSENERMTILRDGMLESISEKRLISPPALGEGLRRFSLKTRPLSRPSFQLRSNRIF